jgi:periplasmic mercuric ion binding protein
MIRIFFLLPLHQVICHQYGQSLFYKFKFYTMKSLKIIAGILFSLFISNTSFAQKGTVKKETVKVWGNCGMCKAKIEKAAKSAGATKANWNEESKMLQVTYNTSKSSSAKIQEAIAKTGYDTQDYTADNTAYTKLHGCCQYDRKETPAKQ